MRMRRSSYCCYGIFGPTTVHLELEFYQWIAMLCLTLSSLRAVHQQDDFYWGDFKYSLLVALYLGRDALIRWICTSDRSTHKNPSLRGVAAHWLCSLFVGGQYFNRPNRETVSKQLGTYHADNGKNEDAVTLSDFILPSTLYTWHTIKVRIIFPFLEAKDSLLSRLPSQIRPAGNENYSKLTAADHKMMDPRKGKHRSSSSIRFKFSRFYSHWKKRLGGYLPPAQTIPIVIFMLPMYFLLLGDFSDIEDRKQAMTVHTRARQEKNGGMTSVLRYGNYRRFRLPSSAETLYMMSMVGTSAAILLYGRVFIPLWDLVEGGNVLKAIRNESKPNQPTGHGNGKSKSKHQKEITTEVTWPEQYTSVANENRFRLLCKATSIRVVENLFVCAFLPRTNFICRFTGHCSAGMAWSQLTKILYPSGVATVMREDGELPYLFVHFGTERGAAIATIASVVLITVCTLMIQGATLNRSYLSMMGCLAGGWTIVSHSHPTAMGQGGAKPMPWDPRKEYKKGDLICQPFPGIGSETMYMATTHQPEGKPSDLSLRMANGAFRNEHCHPANSDLIKFLVRWQLTMIVGLIIAMLCYHILNQDCGSLRWIVLANLVATYGTISSMKTRGLSEIETLAKEVQEERTT